MQRLRVLLAEDHPVNQAVIGAILSQQGHDYEIVENGLEALQLLERESFDVILMDMQMAVMDGYEASREIRRREAVTGKHIRIIAVTGNTTEKDQAAFIAAGIDGYIAKPVNPQLLIAMLTGESVSTVRGTDKPGDQPLPVLPVQVLNTEQLDARVLGQKSPSVKMASLFLNELPTNIATLETALAENDTAQIKRTAHRMGGAAAMLGAEQMALLAEELESDATTGVLNTLPGLIERVKIAAEILSRELEAFINLSS